MKLIIQIPCYNEAQYLPVALAELPREVPGFSSVEWLVIDDGSTDGTAEVARKHGVDHIIRFTTNKGLAASFVAGLEKCIGEGADVIVNTDADNQYNASDIPRLVAPILGGEADIVVGARPIESVEHFSTTKKMLQRIGSWVVRRASQTSVPDTTSGFRALSRDAAMHMNVFNVYTYTLETIIEAGHKGMAVTSVPIRVNEDLRPSRLVRSIPSYIKRSIFTIVRIFVVYRPFRFFMWIGLTLFLAGFAIGMRFLYFYLAGEGGGHIQSVVLSAILLGMGFQTILVAFIADLLATNRKLLEEVQYFLRRMSTRTVRLDSKERRDDR